jgi:hypothetical protein
MLFLLSLMIRAVARLLVLPRTEGATKDLEILVLRHQLRVLGRKTGRPRFTILDRVLLATASRLLPRDRWASFLVTPQTLGRWHRTLVRRKWTGLFHVFDDDSRSRYIDSLTAVIPAGGRYFLLCFRGRRRGWRPRP